MFVYFCSHFPLLLSNLLNCLLCAQALLSRVGPFGGYGGRARDIRVTPHRLEDVTIHSANVVHSLAFSYADHNGQQHSTGPWGSRDARVSTVSNLALIFRYSCFQVPTILRGCLLCYPVITFSVVIFIYTQTPDYVFF